jgi:predicted amidohydrolase YtcJ
MTVLSDDLLTIDPTSLDKVRVLRTIVGGDVVYEAR